MSGLYSPDLARIHAEGFTATFAQSFDWLAETLQHGPTPPKLFDVGCGDGAWLDAARSRGVMGAGIDLSPAFVARARQRGLDVCEGNAANASIPSGTTAITCLGEVLSYIDPATGHDTLVPFAQTAFDALPSGGLVLADLIGHRCLPQAARHSGDDWAVRVEVTVGGSRLSRRIETQVADRIDWVTHHQTRRAPQATKAALEAIGWRCDILQSYGPAPLLPGHFAIHLIKP
ncbi:methyltransferase domain-containing protein [Shimia sp. R10_1]|uniref:methyltransferase domain-containing protein n=1 Tax=Shimia sp. R10_1 TaxID=2821095 RepID=UPI001ADBF451|nr:methyltransferase domain-containing protein [Shimia sp. R10_1]MBO9472303.1 methyltransferase domain-containing protein [Shimia sp. R10_1]